ncbi:hypothetical protein D3C86_1233710 [compost metagenome]
MPTHRQAHACQEQQQRAIGQRAAIGPRIGLAAEGERERLHFVTPAEQIGGIPDEGAGAEVEQRRGQPRRVRRAEPAAKQPDHDAAEPEHERAVLTERPAGDVRHQPILRAARGKLPHHAEARGILVLPRVAAEQAGQPVDDADGQQQGARQRAGGGGGQVDGRGLGLTHRR